MTTDNPQLPDAEQLYQRLLEQIRLHFSLAAGQAAPDNLKLVGIYSGGAWLADRLSADLGISAPGYIDVSFYRDDYAAKGMPAQVKPSQIPFSVEAAQLILVDDVLYTGRTTRAAINELFDYGRPARIWLATLFDRGGRELPIAADFSAWQQTLTKGCSVNLNQDPQGRLYLSVDSQ